MVWFDERVNGNVIVNDKVEKPVSFPVSPGLSVAFDDDGIARLCEAQDLVPGLPLRDYEVNDA